MMTRMSSCILRLLLVGLCMSVGLATNRVLLVSMDGFRWDYINRARTPNFDTLARMGTHAPYINNSFITKTFPNHFTIVTGLNEESHGIIGNHMFDPVFNSTFNMGTKDSKWWDGGEPIWVTARKHNLRSATYYWPGSESEIRGYRPNIWLAYNESVPFTDRVDTVMKWFTSEKMDVVTLYFHEPDSTGHQFGPDSPEIISKVEEMDSTLGYLIKSLKENGLMGKINLIVTSDHGMTSTDFENRSIDISQLASMTTDIDFTIDSGPIMQITPKGNAAELVRKLNNYNLSMDVYLKKDIPEFWHYKNNRRVMPVFAVANEGWSLIKDGYKGSLKGNHGYDNRLLSMKPIFYAVGPSFKTNYKANTFRNVDIYPMICQILGIPPAPNNGSMSRVRDFITIDNANSAVAAVGVGVNIVVMLILGLTCTV